jgi:hypothetical protein
MSAAIVVALAIGAASTLVLIVLMAGLYRHLKVLLASLKQYRDEIQPVLEEIQASADSARTRAEAVPRRLPDGLPGVKRGARLGR